VVLAPLNGTPAVKRCHQGRTTLLATVVPLPRRSAIPEPDDTGRIVYTNVATRMCRFSNPGANGRRPISTALRDPVLAVISDLRASCSAPGISGRVGLVSLVVADLGSKELCDNDVRAFNCRSFAGVHLEVVRHAQMDSVRLISCKTRNPIASLTFPCLGQIGTAPYAHPCDREPPQGLLQLGLGSTTIQEDFIEDKPDTPACDGC